LRKIPASLGETHEGDASFASQKRPAPPTVNGFGATSLSNPQQLQSMPLLLQL
jgi:hypothetical protein